MKCKFCKQNTAEIFYENKYQIGVRCKNGCAYTKYKPIKKILKIDSLDFKIKGCLYRDILQEITECFFCQINENPTCKSQYENILKRLKTPIMDGYHIKHIKGEKEDVFNFGSEKDLMTLREFRPLRKVKLIIKEECSGRGLIHDDKGQPMNYLKKFEIIAWKGATKTGNKTVYFITDKIIKKYFW